MRKSENAKLTTNKFAGVRRLAVDMKMEMTTKFPARETIVKMTMTKPRMLCHNSFNGANWYLRRKRSVKFWESFGFLFEICIKRLPIRVNKVEHVREDSIGSSHVAVSGGNGGCGSIYSSCSTFSGPTVRHCWLIGIQDLLKWNAQIKLQVLMVAMS